MLITEIKITKLHQASRLVAIVDLTFSNMIAIHDIKILKSTKDNQSGYYFAMPCKLMGSQFFDLVHPISNEVRIKLEQLIFRGFDYLLENNYSRVVMTYNEISSKTTLLQQMPADFKFQLD